MMDISTTKQKWKHFFNLIDANKDGVLELEDFVLISERLAHLFHRKGVKEKEESFKWKGQQLFDDLKNEMKTEENSISLENWYKWLEDITVHGHDSHVYRSFTLAICREIFNVCDQNSDGYISRPEFNEIYLVFNIPNPVSSQVFYNLDHNKDGVISRVELLEGIRHFFIDTNSSQYDHMFGDF